MTTGVAKGRDRLDSAVSTSALRESDIVRLAPRSIGDLLRDLPGVRSEAGTGEGNAAISIRGLPLASTGSKYVQIQEDGLPILEFGDMLYASPDSFLRADFNLAQVESIRGGSASTFVSNAPGGIFNFISRTGDVEGGAVQATAGLDYKEYRLDFDYGGRISDTLRYHIGGFYRQGDGPRRAGFDAARGGQIKANITKTFDGGYLRLTGKYLDDRTPAYDVNSLLVSGTDSDPKFHTVPGFDPRRDATLSRYITSVTSLDGNNNRGTYDLRDGRRSLVKSFGIEAQADVAGFTVSERFRFADISGAYTGASLAQYMSSDDLLSNLRADGGTLAYANGPNKGLAIEDPASLNGNGLLARLSIANIRFNSLDNVTNDVRASRIWPLFGGDLTTTAGFYAARQSLDSDWLFTTDISDVRGDGRAVLIDVVDADGVPVTQDGTYAYQMYGGALRRSYRVDYGVNAPYASMNYHLGRIAVGGSVRYDFTNARGKIVGADLNRHRGGTVSFDINGDGVISDAETRVGFIPEATNVPVDYAKKYLSYSIGVNFRAAERMSIFARYSRGARANADRLLFSTALNFSTGKLTDRDLLVNTVKQAEAGVKYRTNDLTLNLTGFWAETDEDNVDTVSLAPIDRTYRAKGVEFEGGYRHGLFSLTANATYTDAKIVRDFFSADRIGNRPRHQAPFIFQASPSVTIKDVSAGAVFIGTTDSYAQDDNLLKMPGYVTTNAFVQVRPTERLMVTLNANNLFNTLAITSINEAALPANGIVHAQVLNGRTVSLSARLAL